MSYTRTASRRTSIAVGEVVCHLPHKKVVFCTTILDANGCVEF